ncbi:hypothetical protein [Streptomyces tritici]|uniref:hypothetical protein n=1 Tax=Streptomyces tritici TaxID=2054410 RepID=UPI003AF181EA
MPDTEIVVHDTENRGDMGDIDHDTVLRARVFLLGSGRLDLLGVLNAYRVLAEASPKAYRPKLVSHLLGLRFKDRRPQAVLPLAAEAVEAARRIEPDDPARERLLYEALNIYQEALRGLGLRAEGRVACEELAEVGGFTQLAAVLSEEGRFAEAVELDRRAAGEAEIEEPFFWRMVAWAADLEAAGLHEEAVDVLGELMTRQDAPPAVPVWVRVQRSRLWEAAGRGAEAATARKEAMTELEALAKADEQEKFYVWERWACLFLMSVRADEPAPTPQSPMPPFGRHRGWSGEVERAYAEALPGLEATAARLREAGRPAELVDLHRRITARVVRRERHQHRTPAALLGPHFDEGVELARRLTDDAPRLSRALTDRAAFLVAAGAHAAAHDDLAEAVALLDAR